MLGVLPMMNYLRFDVRVRVWHSTSMQLCSQAVNPLSAPTIAACNIDAAPDKGKNLE